MNSTEVAIPEDLKALLEKQAAKEVEQNKSGDRVYLSGKGKRWKIDGEQLPDDLHVVIIATAFERVYYDAPYDPDEAGTPACFALGTDVEPIEPHADSPNKQSKLCRGCPHDEFKSARVGKGKACKNYRRLALYPYGPDGLDTSQMAAFKVPPTSLKNWSGYAKRVGLTHNLPTFAVVTSMTFDAKFDFPVVNFETASMLPADEIKTVMERLKDAEDAITTPYNVEDYVAYEEAASSGKKSKMS